jgi:hypothetical protein
MKFIACRALLLKIETLFPRPIQDHLCRASDLHGMLVLFGTKLATLPPADLMSVSDSLASLAIHGIVIYGLRYSSQVLMI